MSVVLFMHPTVPPLDWEKFCKTYPSFSVAIDGFVRGGPRFDEEGPRINFNHHEEVNRLATRATCGQVFVAVKQGFFACFCNEQGPHANVYANDCDEDVCLSWTILRNGYNKEFIENPALKSLIETLDLLDTTAGTYPFPHRYEMLEYIAWIFRPYREFRLNGGVDKKDERTFSDIVYIVENRIIQYLSGKGEKIPLDTRYRVVSRETNWTMVEELGPQARVGMSADGIRAFVSVRRRPDGKSWTYTIGRTSLFIPFPLATIFAVLSSKENITAPNNCWGGGDTIGGSPRVEGSKLPPQELTRIINGILKA